MTTNTVLTRCVSRFCGLLVRMLAYARFMARVDAAVVINDHYEHVLNLPGKLSFFPTQATDPKRVKALIRRLHPVICDLVRLGPAGDGGYLVPNDLGGLAACFSPGVSSVAGFERDCAVRGMDVFMADASIEKPPESNPRFNFLKKYIGSTTRGDFISFEDWVKGAAIDEHADLLLQMDIEGYEYETLLSVPTELQKRFRIIVVEFHHMDYLFSEPLFALYSRAFEKLLSTHSCVHIHPNNICRPIKVGGVEIPQMAEFTFLRNDRISRREYAMHFPHLLDSDNCPEATVHLPPSCYGGG